MTTIATFSGACVCTAAYLWMMQNRIAEKIRESSYWPIAWLGSIWLLGSAGGLWIQFFTR